MTIEKLTAEERRTCGCEKALRIIDQLTAALEAARSQRNDAQALLERNMFASRARAAALQARVTELEDALRIAEAREAEWADIERLDGILTMILPPRAEAEQAVLDAMGDSEPPKLRALIDMWPGSALADACRAEFARRGLTP